MELLGPERWHHVRGMDNPASRGLYPSELMDHALWWDGPPPFTVARSASVPEEEKEVSHVTLIQPMDPVIPIEQFSSFTHLKRVTAWILRFVGNCHASKNNLQRVSDSLLNVAELQKAEVYWLVVIKGHQRDHLPFSMSCTSEIQSPDLTTAIC